MVAQIKPIKEMHSEEVKTRLRPEDDAYLRALCARTGTPVGVWVRQVVMSKIEQVRQEKHATLAN